MLETLGIISTLFLPILWGGILARPFHRFGGISGWLAAGTLTGFITFTVLCFSFSFLQGKISWLVILASHLVFIGLIYLVRVRLPTFPPDPYGEIKNINTSLWSRWLNRIFLFSLLAVMIVCMREVIIFNKDGLFCGFVHNFNDLTVHLHYLTSFALADNFPPYNPMFSGAPLRYPFLSDFYSAVIYFATQDFELALEWPGIFLAFSLIILFYQWILHLTQSRFIALGSPFLFLFSGTMGWYYWILDLTKNPSDVFAQIYSIMRNHNLQFGNMIHAYWITQRSFQWSFPLLILLCAIAFDGVKDRNQNKILFATLLAAPLPFIHGHSIIFFGLFGFFLILSYPSKFWVQPVINLGIFWIPQVLYLSGKIGPGIPFEEHVSIGFLRPNFGWYSKGWEIIPFWFRNLGPFIPLLLWGSMIRKGHQRELKILFWSALILFILGNIYQFSNWEWDNSKVLILWYFFSIPFVLIALEKIWKFKKLPLQLVVILFIASLTLSGFLDLGHALKKGGEDTRILTAHDLKAAEYLKLNTPKNAIFLIALYHNHPLILTGRTIMIGFPGTAWTHGIPHWRRESEVLLMGRGKGKKEGFGKEEAIENFKKHKVTHVLYGPKELKEGYKIDFLARIFQKKTRIGPYVLLEDPYY